ncbi:MAG: hypothetical protein ACP5RT_01100 [Candidatus Micrarchaeia archaeon]
MYNEEKELSSTSSCSSYKSPNYSSFLSKDGVLTKCFPNGNFAAHKLVANGTKEAKGWFLNYTMAYPELGLLTKSNYLKQSVAYYVALYGTDDERLDLLNYAIAYPDLGLLKEKDINNNTILHVLAEKGSNKVKLKIIDYAIVYPNLVPLSLKNSFGVALAEILSRGDEKVMLELLNYAIIYPDSNILKIINNKEDITIAHMLVKFGTDTVRTKFFNYAAVYPEHGLLTISSSRGVAVIHDLAAQFNEEGKLKLLNYISSFPELGLLTLKDNKGHTTAEAFLNLSTEKVRMKLLHEVISNFDMFDAQNAKESFAYIMISLNFLGSTSFRETELCTLFKASSKEEKKLLLLIYKYAEENGIYIYKLPGIFSKEMLREGKPIYTKFLGLIFNTVNLDNEEKNKIIRAIKKSDTAVKKALLFRGLWFAYKDVERAFLILKTILKNENEDTLPRSFEILKEINEYIDRRLINYTDIAEFFRNSNGKSLLDWVCETLTSKIANVLELDEASINQENLERITRDPKIVFDIITYSTNFRNLNISSSYDYLKKIINSYLSGGINGLKVFKYQGHELASSQLRYSELIEKLKALDEKENIIYYYALHDMSINSLSKSINLYNKHSEHINEFIKDYEIEIGMKLLELNNKAGELKQKNNSDSELLMLIKKAIDSANSNLIAVRRQDENQLSYEAKKMRGVAINLIRISEVLCDFEEITKAAKQIGDTLKTSPKNTLSNFFAQKSKIFKKYYLEVLLLSNSISKNKPNNVDIMLALEGLESVFKIVSEWSENAEKAKISARVTFDLTDILKFGRYGSSGSGNCQVSTSNPFYNQSILGMLADANQLVVAFDDSSGNILGFMQIHILYYNLHDRKEPIMLFENDVYTNVPEKEEAMKEAAKLLASFIERRTGIKAYTPSDAGMELDVIVPGSYVNRYFDFLQILIDATSCDFSVKINVEPFSNTFVEIVRN